jgi:hypothetical protein
VTPIVSFVWWTGINYFLHQNGISSTGVGRKRSKVRVDDLDDAGFCPLHYAAGTVCLPVCLLVNTIGRCYSSLHA